MIAELARGGRHLLEENGFDRNTAPVCDRK